MLSARSSASEISIHAPREGSDARATRHPITRQSISIHAPREGSDRRGYNELQTIRQFQSTLPVRGATLRFLRPKPETGNFNPRSP